jgi:predicted TIM-barrel fold metal-dependent hydrolase
MQYECVSGDDHMDLNYIPARLWQERVPAKFRDDAPRVEETHEGRRWICEGKTWGLGNYGTQKRGVISGAITRAGLEEEPEPWVFRPSTPKYRIEDMNRDRVDAQVIYGPPLPLTFNDPELRIVCLEAYNTWMAEFCSAAPERLLGIAMLPMHEPAAAVNELNRVAKLGGLKGALFGVFDAVKPVFDEEWESLWAVAAEAGIPISFHLGGGVRSVRAGDSSRGQLAAFVSAVPMQLDEALCEIIFCGALDAHRKLKVVIAEGGIGWVPYLLNRMDHEYDKAFRHSVKLSAKPSELFRRQMFVTFQEDDIGLKLLDDLGEDNVIWASDYPHFDAIWPNSRKYIDEHMSFLSPAVRRKITCDNAMRLYNLT